MKRNYYIVALIMLIFFVISFLTNVIGPLIPDMITGFNLSLTLVALLPFAFFIAYGYFKQNLMMIKACKLKVCGLFYWLQNTIIYINLQQIGA